MREVNVETPCALNAEDFWSLRSDLACERYMAAFEDKTVELVSDSVFCNAVGEEMATRTLKMVFSGSDNPVPVALRRVISPEDVVPVITETWFVKHSDEAHPCTISVVMPALGDRISINGKQWVVPIGPEQCIVFSRIEISVSMFGVGGMVEKTIEQEYKLVYEAMPERAASYWRSHRVLAAPTATTVARNASKFEQPTELAPPRHGTSEDTGSERGSVYWSARASECSESDCSESSYRSCREMTCPPGSRSRSTSASPALLMAIVVARSAGPSRTPSRTSSRTRMDSLSPAGIVGLKAQSIVLARIP
jgi:hypothetical protein